MTPLDELYGRGASKALAAALPDKAKVAEVAAEGMVRVYVTWPRSQMKMDCWRERVHFAHLASGRKGLYSDLCESLPPLFRDLGVKAFTASAGGASAEVLRKRGEWREGDPGEAGLVWQL